MNADPKGYTFVDVESGRTMRLVTEGQWKDWIVYKHPDGQWVSLRKATPEDWHALAPAVAATVHAESAKVYVDEPVWPYGRMLMCHMLADSVEALHAMADKIGVSRRWFQNTRYPHYDICKAKRAMAVKFGAVEIDRSQFVEIATRQMKSSAPHHA